MILPSCLSGQRKATEHFSAEVVQLRFVQGSEGIGGGGGETGRPLG